MPTFGVACFISLVMIQGGFPVAPLTPSAVALQARLWALQGENIYSFINEPLSRGCTRRGAGGDRKAPCEPIGKAHLHPKGQRRSPEGDRKALWNKHQQTEWFTLNVGCPKGSKGRGALPRLSPLESTEEFSCKGINLPCESILKGQHHENHGF